MTPPSHLGLPPTIALSWLIRLRWLVVLGQLAAVAIAAAALDPPLPLGELLAVVGLAAASNVALRPLAQRFGAGPLLRAAIGLDIALLTALLALAGGPASHFSVLYLVPVALAALVLGVRMGLLAVAFGALCYASLFLLKHPLPHGHDDDHGLGAHIIGMWLATALVAGVIAIVVGGIASTLRAREDDLRRLEDRAARNARLLSLSTLAAGACHELGTPLATIAVTARELERDAAAGRRGDELVEDARLIRAQVERCRAILAQMGDSTGAASEAPELVAVEALLREVRDGVTGAELGRIGIRAAEPGAQVFAPRASLGRALGNLVRNALDASRPDDGVEISTESDAGSVRFVVRDRGAGMAPGVLARAGEPFFTTKPFGAGKGLGLFLVRAIAEQLGGDLRLESEAGEGTTAILTLPRHRSDGVRAA